MRRIAIIKMAKCVKNLYLEFRVKKAAMTMMSGQRILIRFIKGTLIHNLKLAGGIYRVTRNKLRYSFTQQAMNLSKLAKKNSEAIIGQFFMH